VTQYELLDAQNDRARIDGGFSFSASAFILGLGLLAVLDRIGLPDELLRIGVLALIFCGLAVIAILRRTMRPVEFYVAGRCLPASYAGIVFAGAAFGLFLPFLPPVGDVSFTAIALGFCFGCLWLLFVAGPVLRQNGAYSFADLIARRFPLFSVRIPVVLVVAFCAAAIALGGYDLALNSLVAATGMERSAAILLLGLWLILFVVPGGLSGVIWILAAAAVIAVAALALPLGLGIVSGQPLASPIVGDQMLWVQGLADFARVTGAKTAAGVEFPVVIAFALGVSLLSPLASAAVASRDQATAWRCGVTGTLWLIAGTLLVSATIAAATLALKADVSGHAVADLSPDVLEASGRGAIAICGAYSALPSALATACGAHAQSLQLLDIRSTGLDLLASLPLLRGSEPTLARLAAAFLIVVGAALAASAVQGFVTSLAHDVRAPRRRHLGPASQRLAAARALAIGFIVCAGFWLTDHNVDARFLTTLAIMLSVAILAPLLALSLLPQASHLAAFAALCVAGFMIFHFFLYAGTPISTVGLATDSIFAAADGLAVGLFIAFLPLGKRKAEEAPTARIEPSAEPEAADAEVKAEAE
jgi:cation/acetate symporter